MRNSAVAYPLRTAVFLRLFADQSGGGFAMQFGGNRNDALLEFRICERQIVFGTREPEVHVQRFRSIFAGKCARNGIRSLQIEATHGVVPMQFTFGQDNDQRIEVSLPEPEFDLLLHPCR